MSLLNIGMHGPLLLLIASIALAGHPVDEPADTLVLCPRVFHESLQPWIAYRQQQGHRIRVIEPAQTSFAIQRQVRDAAAKHPLRNLVIIGDAAGDPRGGRERLVPTDYKIAMVNVQFGGEPDIATDNTYADIDGDGVMDLTLGRIPVDSPQQLSVYIDKIIAYENHADFGPWRRKINLVAGTGNFNPLLDKIIENASKQMITELIPASYDTSMTLASWQSAYCPDPRRMSQTVVERMNEGCLFWVYIGHGLTTSVAPMRVGRYTFPVFDCDSAAQVRSDHGLPIAVFLACYSGAFDRSQDCLGEVLVCQPQGPVACLCGSRMTMPYGMATLSYEIMNEFFRHDHETLGEIILCAKQQLAANRLESDHRRLIEDLGQSFSPRQELLPLERFEHLQMFHLLGDPLLRVPRPRPLEMRVETSPDDPERIQITGEAPVNGSLLIDLAYRRDRIRIRPDRRKTFEMVPASLAKYDKTYRDSNDLTCVSQTIQVSAGEFKATLRVPKEANGDCHVRAFLSAEQQSYSNAVPIVLR